MTEMALQARSYRLNRWVQRIILIALVGLGIAVLGIGVALYAPSQVIQNGAMTNGQ
ncbi:MAG: hypothetical protein ACT4TC_17465 [Myxococcaceae bacterium]